MFQSPSHRPGCGFPGGCGPDIDGNSDVLARIEAAGADLIGITAMTELAYEPSGFNDGLGRVKNPWNPDFISGGSSSGSAVAVASGIVTAALGSDTGGSLRIPAFACGVTAWKPTHGLVSIKGAMALAPKLDSIGLLARSANDMMPLLPFLGDFSAPGKIIRAAVLADVAEQSDPAIRQALADVIAVLGHLGVATANRAALPVIKEIDRHCMIVMQAESARTHRSWLDSASVAPSLRRRLAKGLEISDATLAESTDARPRLIRTFEQEVLAGHDVAVLPVMAILTPSAAECDPGSDRFSPRTLYALSRFTRFVNMMGLPAVAIPAGFDQRGMPVGLQIVGRVGTDLALLDLVRRIQSTTDWHGRLPSAIVGLVPKLETNP
jgi:aspartyl-tRNA(Asn)/glutamyl-tRNA(Gln) amidotransferase subunit A